jgi:AcrR family transcriptional regulator
MTESETRSLSAKPSRKDASENRARLLAAARARIGRPVSSREIARAAGVSVATLYRNFRTRDELVAAAQAEQELVCTASIDRAVTDPDPGRALRVYLREVLAAQAAGFRSARTGRTRFQREMNGLLTRAKAAGAVRPDVTVADLRLIFAANAGVLAGRDRKGRSERLTELALTGLGLQP